MINNERHGIGRLIIQKPENSKNTIIEGEFKNSMINGYGRMIFPDGSYYMGGFKNNLMHGSGIFYDENGIANPCKEWDNGEQEMQKFVD